MKKNQLVVGFPIDEGVIYVQNHDQPGIMSPAYNVWDFDSDRILPAYLEFVLHSPQSMAYYSRKNAWDYRSQEDAYRGRVEKYARSSAKH